MTPAASAASADLLGVLVRMVSADDPGDGSADGSASAVLERSRHVLAQVPAPEVAELVRLARAHGVEPWLAAAVPPQWPEAARAEAHAQRVAFLAATTRQRSAVRVLTQAWAGLEVPWSLLKGLSLADRVYPRPDLRFGVDVDVLVAPTHFRTAVTAAQSAGFELLDRNWPMLRQLEVGQLRLRSAAGTLVDVHWHVINARPLRRAFRLATGELLERSTAAADGGPRQLSAPDELVHVALHAATSGGNRLVWLCDVDRLVRRGVVDWAQVVAAARAAGAGAAVALVLRRCRDVLGTPVPDDVLVALAGRVWPVLSSRADRSLLRPDPSAASLPRALSRAARGTAARSLLALASNAVRHAARPAGAGVEESWLDPDSPTSGLYDVESPADRDAYFASVARQP